MVEILLKIDLPGKLMNSQKIGRVKSFRTTFPPRQNTHIIRTNFSSVTFLKNPKFFTKRWKTQKHLAKVHIVGIIELFLFFSHFIIICFAKRNKYFTRVISALPKHTGEDQKPISVSLSF